MQQKKQAKKANTKYIADHWPQKRDISVFDASAPENQDLVERIKMWQASKQVVVEKPAEVVKKASQNKSEQQATFVGIDIGERVKIDNPGNITKDVNGLFNVTVEGVYNHQLLVEKYLDGATSELFKEDVYRHHQSLSKVAKHVFKDVQQHLVSPVKVRCFHYQFLNLAERINQERRRYLLTVNILDIDAHLINMANTASAWTSAFRIFYEYLLFRMQVEQDGGGANCETREIPLDYQALRSKLYGTQNSDLEEALKIINIMSCLQRSPYQILNDTFEWEPMCSAKFIDQVCEQFSNDSRKQHVLCLYILLAATGFPLLKSVHRVKNCLKYDVNYEIEYKPEHMVFQAKLGSKYHGVVLRDEALLDSKKRVRSVVVTTVLPIASKQEDHSGKLRLVDTKLDSYLMLYDLFDGDVSKGINPSDIEDDAFDFIESLKLSKHWNHYALNSRLNVQSFFPILPEEARERWNHLKCTWNVASWTVNNDGQLWGLGKEIPRFSNNARELAKSYRYEKQLIPISYYSFDEKTRHWVVDVQELAERSKQVSEQKTKQFEELAGMTATQIQEMLDNNNVVQFISRVQRQNQVQADISLLNKMKDWKTAKIMQNILKMMPVGKKELNRQQMTLIKATMNMLVLGRSGTGKTTACVMRMLAQEILYRSLAKFKQTKDQDVVLHSDDLLLNNQVRYAFVTASPVLSNEVKRFYDNLKQGIIKHLKKKEGSCERKKKQQQKEQVKDKGDDDSFEVASDDDQNTEEKKEKEEAKHGEHVEEDEAHEELLELVESLEKDQETLQNQLSLPQAFHALQAPHFPLFTTIHKLIYMLDGSLQNSFFTRNKDGSIVGMSSHLGWHSEQSNGGEASTLMINSHHRHTQDYDAQIAKFGEQLMQMESGDADVVHADQYGTGSAEQAMRRMNWQAERTAHNAFAADDGNGREQQNQKIEAVMNLSFEVTFEVFEKRFYDRMAHGGQFRMLSANTVWTEIFSVIKGSERASNRNTGYLSLYDYLNERMEDRIYLSKEMQQTIYYVFLCYEKWKKNVGAFDFLDVVSHVWNNKHQLLTRHYLDYLLVDEVQDLPPIAIQLLLKLTRHNVFFAGDTAQTIAKGVGAKFGDLAAIFRRQEYVQRPKVIQLSRNYRSSKQILSMANSVVKLVEILFPRAIDRLHKETAKRNNLKPIVLEPVSGDMFKKFFHGASNCTDAASQSAQFGCSQAVIVRDQEHKKKLPEIFQHMLCLTVYEAKGLEFNDVIIYDFFDQSEASARQWDLIQNVKVAETSYKESQSDDDLQDIDSLNAADQQKQKHGKNGKTKKERQPYYDGKQKRGDDYRRFSSLCVELKLLYVAITRAKNRVIIYDNYRARRSKILDYWKAMDVVHVVTEDMLKDTENLPAGLRDLLNKGLVDEKSSPEQWKIQGIKMFRKAYYDEAIKCFEKSADSNLVLRCRAHKLAETAESKRNESNSLQWKVKNYANLAKSTKRTYIRDAAKIRTEAFALFRKAGELFAECENYSFAGSCFYTANVHDRAAEMFRKLDQFAQAGECYFKMRQYAEAALMFEKGDLMPRAIECYEISESWEQLLLALNRCKDKFKDEEREALVNKYVPIALNSLLKVLSGDASTETSDKDMMDKGQLQEMKIRMKYQKNVDQILEDADEDEYGDQLDLTSDDEEPEEEKEVNDVNEGEERQSKEESKSQQQEEASEDDFEVKEDEESDDEKVEPASGLLHQVYDFDSIRQQKENRIQARLTAEKLKQLETEEDAVESKSVKSHMNESFGDIEDDVDDGKFNDDFEHLSHFDPDDMFLQSEHSFSIIDSIVSGVQSVGGKSVASSGFSIVGSNAAGDSQSFLSGKTVKSLTRNVARIESRNDVYIEDVVTQKIIYYISLFSEEVRGSLVKLKQQGLLQEFKQHKSGDDMPDVDQFLIQLDQVDLDFVQMILDILDYYELFKLSIMLSNRYKLYDRLSTYILQLSLKYSNLSMYQKNWRHLALAPLDHQEAMRRKASATLSHEIMHNVLSYFDPKFIGLKPAGTRLTRDNSLGIEALRAMLHLGFWKKIVYISDVDSALALCSKFIEPQQFQGVLQMADLDPSHYEAQLRPVVGASVIREIRRLANPQYMFKNTVEAGVNEQKLSALHDAFEEQNWGAVLRKEHVEALFNLHQVSRFAGNVSQIHDFQKSTIDPIMGQQQDCDSHIMNLFVTQLAQLKGSQISGFTGMVRSEQANLLTLSQINDLQDVCLRQLNSLLQLQKASLAQFDESRQFIDTMLAGFLVADLSADDKASYLFEGFSSDYMVMSVDSPLLSEVLSVQKAVMDYRFNKNIEPIIEEHKKILLSQESMEAALASEIEAFQIEHLDRKTMDSVDQWKKLLGVRSPDVSLVSMAQMHAIIEAYDGSHQNLPRFIDLECDFMLVPRQLTLDIMTSKLQNLRRSLESLTQCVIYRMEINAEDIYESCLLNKKPIGKSLAQVPVKDRLMKQLQGKHEFYIQLQQSVIADGYDMLNKRRQGVDVMLKKISPAWFSVFRNAQKYSQEVTIDSNVLDTLLGHLKANTTLNQFHIGLCGQTDKFGLPEECVQTIARAGIDNAFDMAVITKRARTLCQGHTDGVDDFYLQQATHSLLVEAMQIAVLADQAVVNNSEGSHCVQQFKKLFFDKLQRVDSLPKHLNYVYKVFGDLAFTINEKIDAGNLIVAADKYLEYADRMQELLGFENRQQALLQALYCVIMSKQSHENGLVYGTAQLAIFCDMLTAYDVSNKVRFNLEISKGRVPLLEADGCDSDDLDMQLRNQQTPKLGKAESSMPEESYEVLYVQRKTVGANSGISLAHHDNVDAELEQLAKVLGSFHQLLQKLNADEIAAACKSVYARTYDIIMMIIANYDFEAKDYKKSKVVTKCRDAINQLCADILEGPFESHFSALYLLEQDGHLDAASMTEVYHEFHATNDNVKQTFFEASKALTVINLKQLAVSHVQREVIEDIEKQRMTSYKQAKWQIDEEPQVKNAPVDCLNAEEQKLLQSLKKFGLAHLFDLRHDHAKYLSHLLAGLYDLKIREDLLWDIIQSKNCKSCSEVSFLLDRMNKLQEQSKQLVLWARDTKLADSFEEVKQSEMQSSHVDLLSTWRASQGHLPRLIAKIDDEIQVWYILRAKQGHEVDIMDQRQKRVTLKWSTLKKAMRRAQISNLRAKK